MNEIEMLKKYLLVSDIKKYENEIIDIIPELKYEVGFEQKSVWHCYDVWNHTVHAVNSCDYNFEDRLILLLHDIGKPFSFQDENDVRHFKNHASVSGMIAFNILNRLKLESNKIDEMVKYISNHSISIDLELVNSNNINYYKRLLKLQKCDGSAYEKEHSLIIKNKLDRQEEYILSLK